MDVTEPPPGGGQTYAGAARTPLVEKKFTMKLVKHDSNAKWVITKEDITEVLVHKMKFQPHNIKSIDESEFRKIKVTVTGVNDLNVHLLDKAIDITEGIRVEPMKKSDDEVLVHVYWTSVEMNNGKISAALQQFGELKDDIRHVRYGKGGSELMNQMKHVMTGDRVVRMKLDRFIPSYILIDGKRYKVSYKGQIKNCARCCQPAYIQ